MNWARSIPWPSDAPGADLLARLAAASIEVLILVCIVGAFAAWQGRRRPRLVALLWLVALAKPLVSLVIGAPFALAEFERLPANEEAAAIQTEIRASDSGVEGNLRRAVMAMKARAARERETPQAGGAAGAIAGRASESPKAGMIVPALVGVWIVGFVLMFARGAIAYGRSRRLIKRSGAAPTELQSKYRNLAAAIGVHHSGELKISPDLASPALVGVLSPTTLLPSYLVEPIHKRKAEWAMRHELTHARQCDGMANLLRRFTESVFFFHPAVWWAGARWEDATELACDHAIVGSEEEARDYAEQLFAMARRMRSDQCAFAASGLSAARTQIARRVTALLGPTVGRAEALTPATMLVLALFAVAAVALGIGTRATDVNAMPELEAEAAGETAVFQTQGLMAARISESDGFTSIQLRAMGRLELTAGYRRVTEMDPGSFINLEESGPKGSRELAITRDADGRIRHLYRVNGEWRPYEGEAQTWFGQSFEALVQSSDSIYELLPRAELLPKAASADESRVRQALGRRIEMVMNRRLASAGLTLSDSGRQELERAVGRIAKGIAEKMNLTETTEGGVRASAPFAVVQMHLINHVRLEMAMPRIDLTREERSRIGRRLIDNATALGAFELSSAEVI